MNSRRSSLGLTSCVLLLAALTGCGNGTASDHAAEAQVSETSTPHEDVQSCQALLDSGWKAPEGEPSFEVDPDRWLVEVGFDEENSFTVDLANDPACAKLPDIGAPLARIVPEYEQMRIEECTDAVEDVIAGRAPKKGPVTGTVEALRQHVIDWCPPSFAEKLPPK
jgi:hypothetical protein